MTPLHQMLLIVLSGLLGFLLMVGIFAVLKLSSHSTHSALPAGVLKRSQQYINQFGNRTFTELKTNQKLILIHSYYNLEHHHKVVQHAETMIDELRQLPPERKRAYVEMIETSYRQLGQGLIITEFREAVGR